jgi:hypothetical protein
MPPRSAEFVEDSGDPSGRGSLKGSLPQRLSPRSSRPFLRGRASRRPEEEERMFSLGFRGSPGESGFDED